MKLSTLLATGAMAAGALLAGAVTTSLHAQNTQRDTSAYRSSRMGASAGATTVLLENSKGTVVDSIKVYRNSSGRMVINADTLRARWGANAGSAGARHHGRMNRGNANSTGNGYGNGVTPDRAGLPGDTTHPHPQPGVDSNQYHPAVKGDTVQEMPQVRPGIGGRTANEADTLRNIVKSDSSNGRSGWNNSGMRDTMQMRDTLQMRDSTMRMRDSTSTTKP